MDPVPFELQGAQCRGNTQLHVKTLDLRETTKDAAATFIKWQFVGKLPLTAKANTETRFTVDGLRVASVWNSAGAVVTWWLHTQTQRVCVTQGYLSGPSANECVFAQRSLLGSWGSGEAEPKACTRNKLCVCECASDIAKIDLHVSVSEAIQRAQSRWVL